MVTLSAILVLCSLVASVVIVVLLISAIWPSGAPWVPTPRSTVRRMIEIADVQPGEVVYDLGSGDGRMLIIAARHFGARAVGIEIDPLRYLISRMLIAVMRVQEQTRVIWGDFFKADLSEADVVTCYLLAKTNVKIMEKLQTELRPGTRVVSHTFTFPGWDVEYHDADAKVYLYTIRPERNP